jgi:molybdopterin converting factor small subunit
VSIKMKISPELQQFIGNRESVDLEGNTIREALDSLAKNYQASAKWFYHKNGEPAIWVILNNKIVFAKDFNKSLSPKDSLSIMRVFGGG